MRKILILFIAFLFLSACTQPGLIREKRLALGTIVEIAVADKNKPNKVIAKAIEKAFAEIERIETLLSRFNPQSDISRINQDCYVRATKVSPETIDLLERSIEFSRLTNGAFDITVWPLIETWGVDQGKRQELPSVEELVAAMDRVSYSYIDIIESEQSIFLARPGMSLDLGGIAKGYAVDRAGAVLKQEGIESALINAGGDIYAFGQRGEEQKWNIALEHPRKTDVMLTALELKDQAVATSGDYQKYIEIEGKRYSHIINPKTGYPATDAAVSVTVLADTCLAADALATSVSVLGPEQGLQLIDQLNNTEAIVISFRNGRLDIFLSRGLSEEEVKFNTEANQ